MTTLAIVILARGTSEPEAKDYVLLYFLIVDNRIKAM